jgi:hypothetical protein
MTEKIQINPGRLASLESSGWRAYYDRDWPQLVSLMVQLNQEQFHIPFPLSVQAALHVARGSSIGVSSAIPTSRHLWRR